MIFPLEPKVKAYDRKEAQLGSLQAEKPQNSTSILWGSF
jgi:hypothetical protein